MVYNLAEVWALGWVVVEGRVGADTEAGLDAVKVVSDKREGSASIEMRNSLHGLGCQILSGIPGIMRLAKRGASQQGTADMAAPTQETVIISASLPKTVAAALAGDHFQCFAHSSQTTA